MIIKQGEEYYIPIRIQVNRKPAQEKDLALVEVYFNQSRHTWPGDMTFHDSRVFLPMTQEMSFALTEETGATVDVRAKLANGTVLGIDNKIRVRVTDAVSREVL